MNIIILDHKKYRIFPINESYEFGLIIKLNDDKNAFDIIKNRYGRILKDQPIEKLLKTVEEYVNTENKMEEKKNEGLDS